MHPALLINALGAGRRIVPVTEHDAVATRAQLTDFATWYTLPGAVDDFALQVRLGAANGGNAQFEVIVRACLQ
ncbi:hypothetical protein D3C80_1438230 [compost metagenome]